MQLSTQNKFRLVPPSLVKLSLEEGRHCESIKFKVGEHASKKSNISSLHLAYYTMMYLSARSLLLNRWLCSKLEGLLQAQDQVVTFVDCDLPQKHSPQCQLECTKLIAQYQIRYKMFSDLNDRIKLALNGSLITTSNYCLAIEAKVGQLATSIQEISFHAVALCEVCHKN